MPQNERYFPILLHVEYDEVCSEVELVHLYSTSLITPLEYLMDLSAN